MAKKCGTPVYKNLFESSFVQADPNLCAIVERYVNHTRANKVIEISPWRAAKAILAFAASQNKEADAIDVETFIEMAEKLDKEEQGKTKQLYADNLKKYLGQQPPYRFKAKTTGSMIKLHLLGENLKNEINFFLLQENRHLIDKILENTKTFGSNSEKGRENKSKLANLRTTLNYSPLSSSPEGLAEKGTESQAGGSAS